MKFTLSRTIAAIGIIVAAVSSGAVSTPAANIVDEWASVKAPPPARTQTRNRRPKNHRAADARLHESELRQATALC